MSEDVGSTAGMARDDLTGSYSASGGLLRAAAHQSPGQSDQLGVFVQQQPLTAALVALAIGYILGKIS